jgi:uncharacterized protein
MKIPMTLYFPDINVWIALTVQTHIHTDLACRWMSQLPASDRVLFTRYTQLGILRLLTNASVMKEAVLTLRYAWAAFDTWSKDPRVEFVAEPPFLDSAFRRATDPFADQPASKWIGDCYLLAFARQANATLVTFDRALHKLALASDCSVTIPE